MKNKFLIIAILASFTANAQYDRNWAIGGKIGEPLGLNLRKYFRDGDRSFDLTVGTYGFIYGRKVTYANKDVYDQAGLMMQGIYNFQKTMGKNGNFHAYYGYGAQINSRKLVADIGARSSVKQVSVGGAANAGMEYKLPNDIGIFVETGLYLELVPRIFLPHLQINGGLRLNLVR